MKDVNGPSVAKSRGQFLGLILLEPSAIETMLTTISSLNSLVSETTPSLGFPFSYWLLLPTHLSYTSLSSQPLSFGVPPNLVFMFLLIFSHSLGDFIQAYGQKHNLYTHASQICVSSSYLSSKLQISISTCLLAILIRRSNTHLKLTYLK